MSYFVITLILFFILTAFLYFFIDGVYFIRLNSTFWPLFHLKDDGLPYSIERCKLEVIKLNENGIMCGGFNYNKVNSSCTFFGHSFYYYVAILNNPTFDTFLMSEAVGKL